MTLPKAAHKAIRAQLDAYRTAAARLLLALEAQARARAEYDAARDALEDERRRLLLEGVPNLPDRPTAEQREAALGRALDAPARAMRKAREALRTAETELEAARVQERAEREVLRVLTNDPTE